MKFVAVILCATFILASAAAEAGVKEDPEPPPSPISTTTTTLKPTTTAPITTTTENATTTAPTTAPTTKTTTTQKPTTTTTMKPTTSTSKPTTQVPTTTPTPPITTVKPTPTPVPQSGQWIVSDGNKTCIIVKMTAQFNVTYLNGSKTVSREIVLPRDNETVPDGVCGENEQVLNITWPSTPSANNSLTFHFVVDGTKAYAIHHIEMSLALNELPNINSNKTVMLIHNMTEYKTGLGNSYRCGKLQRVSLTSEVTNTTGEIEVTDFQFQAFRTDSTKTFGAAEDCAVETADVVPIAVGCSLIILVIIVLVAYLVGRRRRQAGGYLSM